VTFNSKAGSRLHPTEKPVLLLKYLIELFSNKGDLILDPFAGSASTGEAAITTSRRAILVERDHEFYEKGSLRIAKSVSAMEDRLFN
jgi:site-specific DNA-methyltransferase (adenine-specific)